MSSDVMSYNVEFDLDAIARETARRIAEAHDQRVFEILERTYGFVRPVRCRDCEHFESDYTDGAMFGATVCWAWDNGHDYPHYTNPDGFCHRGERREE